MRDWESRPLHTSLEAIAELALLRLNARGFAFFESDHDSGLARRLIAHGPEVPGLDENAPPVAARYRLAQAGGLNEWVAFSFSSVKDRDSALSRLGRIAAAIESVWAVETAVAYNNLASRIAMLELQLIDSKITDRARGFLSGAPPADWTEAIARHVEAVLRPSQSRVLFEEVLLKLKEEVDERKLLAEAKQILRAAHGISEEQAHTELRLASRKSRKRLKEVAVHVIQRRTLPKEKSA